MVKKILNEISQMVISVFLGAFTLIGISKTFNQEFEWYYQVPMFMVFFFLMDVVCWLKRKK